MSNTTEIWSSTRRTDLVDLCRTEQQLKEASERWNSRALNGQVVQFTKAEGYPPEEREKNTATYWTGTVTSAEGEIYILHRCEASGLVRKAERHGMRFTMREVTRTNNLLAGVYGRSSIEREEVAKKALEHIREYLAADAVAATVRWDEDATLAELQALLYSADMEAKPLRRETRAEKAAREKTEAVEQYKKRMISRLVATGMSEEEAEQLVNQN